MSLRGFQQLKTLRIEWRLLQPADSEEAFDNEELPDGGFYQADAVAEESKDFDLRSLLPASLEKLYLTGDFSYQQQKELEKIMDNESEYTPRLKKIYIKDSRAAWAEYSEFRMSKKRPDVPGIKENPLMHHLEDQG